MRAITLSTFVIGVSLGARPRLSPPVSTRSSEPLPAWIAGCWEARTASDTLEELWTVPRAGVMLGVSRLVRKDSLVTYEHNSIAQRGDHVVLVSTVTTGSPKEYTAVELKPNTAVFVSTGGGDERVRYSRQGNTLYVRFAHRDATEERGIEQPLTLGACRGL